MNNCIIPNKTLSKDGYPYKWHNGKSVRWARLIYTQHHGEIPAGMVVRHKCDNRACINITHLELGTHQDNMNDMVQRGRSLTGSKHYRSKLVEQDVLDIRNSTLTDKELAKQYNVDRSTIRKIKLRTSWKHI